MEKEEKSETREQLAKRLDNELDEFINSLEKKRYQDGWPEDRWEEEMAKHPFFMKNSPEDGTSVSPLVEGLQQLKFDPTENTPEELAANYKDDGNFNFKHKNYRLAIIGYTEGIKIKCNDDALNASLYNNRSACHFYLENYRSSFNDAKKALTFDPIHIKALTRAAQCALKLKEFDTCIELTIEILSQVTNNTNIDAIKQLQKDAAKGKLIHERNMRKKDSKEKKRTAKDISILNAIRERRIFMEEGKEIVSLTDIDPGFPGSPEETVHWTEDKQHLVWPIVFLYPEFKISDCVNGFDDVSDFCDVVFKVLYEYPPWDNEKQYSPETVNVYYEGKKKFKLFPVDFSKTLLDIMQEPNFELRALTPAFIVLAKDSPTEKSFLKSYGL